MAADGLEVVDFKSNWIKREQVEKVGESYLVQLRLYAWAMARRFGVRARHSQAYFLIPNEIYDLPAAFWTRTKQRYGSARSAAALFPTQHWAVKPFPPRQAALTVCLGGRRLRNPFCLEKKEKMSWPGPRRSRCEFCAV